MFLKTMQRISKSGLLGIGSLLLLMMIWSVARAGGTSGATADASGSASSGVSDPGGAAGAGAPDQALSGVGSSAATQAAVGNLSPTQIDQVKSIMAQGGPSPGQMQQLCASIAAKHLSATDLESIGSSMGLSSTQISQLKSCVQGGPPNVGVSAGVQTGSPSGPPPTSGLSSGLSPIEASFRGVANPAQRFMEPTPTKLRQFGYMLFSSKVSTFAPVGSVPVGPDYILGPDDELNVLFWGRINRTVHLKVERDGTILTPETGPIQVAGLTFEQAKKLIESRAGQITGVQVDVTMGTLRTIQVFVIGKASQPGLYTVSALAHVSNALVAAGGINKIGSLRRIELKRDNRVVRTIDLYDMLLHGSTAADVELRQNDVIFIPIIGPVVGVEGDVKDPAIYELKGNENLKDVLAMAGGVGPFGYTQRVQVERVANHDRRLALDLDFARLGRVPFRVRDGDLIKVFTVLPRQQNVVTLSGNVNRPGVYQWRPGLRVADLIGLGEGVADGTFFDYALIRRVEGPNRRVRFLPVDLGQALAKPAWSDADVPLEPRDQLVIYNEQQLGDSPKVAVTGAVRKPGSYPLTEAMRMSDLIYEAGGLMDNAYLPRAELARTKIINGKAVYIYQDVNLKQALSELADADPALRRGDMVFVQQASNWHTPWTVQVGGEVMRPGPYVIREGERLDSVLERSGGLRTDAYLPASVFIRQSVQQIEQLRLNESRTRLKEEAARLALMPSQAGQGQQGNNTQGLAMMQQVLASTEGQQAIGRIVIHLSTLSALPASPNDVVLENGDRIAVPRRPASVNVLGLVYNPTSIVYQPRLTVRSYLQKAGGPTEGADIDHMFVIAADGSVLTDEGVRNSNRNVLFPLLPVIHGGLMDTRLGPGDTVYVPEKLVYISGLQYATDITTVIANSAMSLAVMGILGASL